MLKFAIHLILISQISFGISSARAEDPIDLTQAFKIIHEAWTPSPTPTQMVADGAAVTFMMTAGMVGLATMVLARRPSLLGSPAEAAEYLRFLVPKATLVANTALITLVGAVGLQLIEDLSKRGGIDYVTADGLNAFFRLPLDRQFRIAEQDPKFSEFLISVARNTLIVKQGGAPSSLITDRLGVAVR